MMGPPNYSVRHYDYHAMHYNAKRGIEMHVVRQLSLSVCLSVCLCV